MEFKEKVKSLAQSISADILTWRRHIHANPELSYQEHNTMDFIAQVLSQQGIEFTKGVGETGVVALIKGANPESKIIALRSDHDALPILEANDVDYSSKNKGVMHACGHDVHTACLLGAATILNRTSDEWEGTVKCIFQPGEERLPGGATLMIKDGALTNPTPEHIIGQHVFPDLEVGHVGMRSGMYMASADELHLTILGKGGHAALPSGTCNPIVVASEVLLEFEKMMESRDEQDVKTVLAFGFIEANGATNVIPNSARLEGTFRSLCEEWRFKAHDLMKEIVASVCKRRGATADFEIRVGYPSVYNNPELTESVRASAIEYLGEDKVHDLPERMTAEDFSFYAQKIPGCFYRIGTASKNSDLGHHGLHTPLFDIDEGALEIGAGLMAWGAINSLRPKGT
ncbi:MAG: N-acyl-L-amino acid amidohydrolase [Crocinitomicaceae bacterium]|nr:N-acyl-L-amino acid amidohydrolase [Crocinitomicaceae bacterium]